MIGLPSALVGAAANLIFVPLFLPVFGATIAGLLLGWGGLSEWALANFTALISCIASAVEGAELAIGLSVLQAVALSTATVLALRQRHLPALAALALGLHQAPREPGLKVWLFPVGHGDLTLVQSDQAAVVVDTGPSPQRLTNNLLPRLLGRPDLLIISHADHDHIGGAGALCALRPPRRIWAQTRLTELGCPAADLPAPIRLGDLVISPLRGADDWVRGRNERSLVVAIEHRSARLLFLGDIGADREEDLSGSFGAADWVKVPHHGSETSSGAALIAETKPRFAAIGAGLADRFGHPSPKVVQRWEQGGAEVQVADDRPRCWRFRATGEASPCLALHFLRRARR